MPGGAWPARRRRAPERDQGAAELRRHGLGRRRDPAQRAAAPALVPRQGQARRADGDREERAAPLSRSARTTSAQLRWRPSSTPWTWTCWIARSSSSPCSASTRHSLEGTMQVHLAQLEYELTRMRGKGHLLSRLGAGVNMRGPGETGSSRSTARVVRKRIQTLRRRIDHMARTRRTQRARRLHRRSRSSRSPATPTPASRPCSTRLPTPRCRCAIGSSRPSIPPRARTASATATT